MKKALFTAFATALQVSCALAGVPLRFDADVRSTSTFQASAYRGETLDIRARLLDGAHPLPVPAGAEAAMLWQTNGMGTAWWSVPATVSTSGVVEATWTPTNDVGAASYRVFLGVAADGRNWRANLLLRLIDAPGASPNELAPPIQSIDFATVEVANAPWLAEESDPTVPAWAKADTPPLSEESDPIWEAEKGDYAKYEYGGLYAREWLQVGSYNSWLFGNGAILSIYPMMGPSGKYSLSYTNYFPRASGTLALDASVAEAARAATNYTDAAIAAIPTPDLSFTNDFLKAESDPLWEAEKDGYATSAGVTNIVRDLSLGGIWDEQIQVWWTPRMRNGSLTYEATTNVNLNTGI